MLSDKDVKVKFGILSNKLKLNLFDEVISETIPLLKKRKHQVFFNILSVAYQSLGDYKKISRRDEGSFAIKSKKSILSQQYWNYSSQIRKI